MEHQKNLEINFLINFVYVDTKHCCSGLPACVPAKIDFSTFQSKVIQYADDTTMSLVSNDISGLKEGLVNDLEGVARWVETNNLNGQKTGVAFE